MTLLSDHSEWRFASAVAKRLEVSTLNLVLHFSQLLG